MELYIIFALLSALSFSFALVINKHVLKNVISNYFLFIFYICLFGLAFAPMVWLVVPIKFPSTMTVFYIIVTAILYFLGMIVTNYTFARGDVSTLGPLMQTKTLFLVFLTFFLLGESFSIGTYLWIVLMIVGGIIVSLDEKFNIKSFFTIFIIAALLSNFLWAMTDIAVKGVMEELDSWNANAWRMLLMSPLALLLLPLTKKGDMRAEEKTWVGMKKIIPMLSIFLLSDVIGLTFMLMAFNIGTVTLTNAFAMMRGPLIIVITFALSIFNPGLLEHHTKKVYLIRFVGSAIMLFAAVQLMV